MILNEEEVVRKPVCTGLHLMAPHLSGCVPKLGNLMKKQVRYCGLELEDSVAKSTEKTEHKLLKVRKQGRKYEELGPWV